MATTLSVKLRPAVMTMTTTIQLDPEIEDRLEQLAQATGRSKDFYVQELIRQGMDELEDAYLGALEAERVHRGESSTRPLDAVMQDLGLDR
jgi:RHH-type transcriptional regulator, rel operon repressor / antitoxin RelB